MSYKYILEENGAAIRCLECLRVSHNTEDVAQRYCGHCREFLDVEIKVFFREIPSPPFFGVSLALKYKASQDVATGQMVCPCWVGASLGIRPAVFSEFDRPIGVARRDIKSGEFVRYSPSGDTEDIAVKVQMSKPKV